MHDIYGAFTDEAREAVTTARITATNFNYDTITISHLVMGLFYCESETIQTFLKVLEVDLAGLKGELEAILQEHSPNSVEPKLFPFTENARELFEQASKYADEFRNEYIGVEHLFCAVGLKPDSLLEGDEAATIKKIAEYGITGLKLREARTLVLKPDYKATS